MVGLRSVTVSTGLSTVLDDQWRFAYVAITLLSRPFRTDIYNTGTPCFSRGRVAVKKQKSFLLFSIVFISTFHMCFVYVFVCLVSIFIHPKILLLLSFIIHEEQY